MRAERCRCKWLSLFCWPFQIQACVDDMFVCSALVPPCSSVGLWAYEGESYCWKALIRRLLRTLCSLVRMDRHRVSSHSTYVHFGWIYSKGTMNGLTL
ncbi:hypothetical protein BJ546DRAFT_977635, partial [Cryomyces antarcticus]